MRIILVISLFAAFSQTADIIDTVVANNYYAEGLSGSEDSALASAARGSDVLSSFCREMSRTPKLMPIVCWMGSQMMEEPL